MNDDTTQSDLDQIAAKFVAAAEKMREHGYFEKGTRSTAVVLIGQLFRFMVNYVKLSYESIMKDKHIDIQVSHNHPVNKVR